MSHLFAFSLCSWGSQGKNTEVICHSLPQQTTFCQALTSRDVPSAAARSWTTCAGSPRCTTLSPARMKPCCPPGLLAPSGAGAPGALGRCSNFTKSALSTLDQRLQPSALYGVLRLPCQGPFTGCSQLQKAVCPGSGCQSLNPGVGRVGSTRRLRVWGLPGWSPSSGAGGGSLRPRGAPGNSRGLCLVVAFLLPRLLSSHGSLSPCPRGDTGHIKGRAHPAPE